MLNSTEGKTETTRHVDFTDDSEINVVVMVNPYCGSWYREHLHRPSSIWVSGEYEIRMDLSTFVHGQSWTTCIDT